MSKCILIRRVGAVLEGNAQPEDVLESKTFYNTEADKIQTGTLALTETVNASDVLMGKTFYSTNAKSKQLGTMPYQGSGIQAISSGQNTKGIYYYIPKGYYQGSTRDSWVYRPLSDFGSATASDVKSGKTFTSSAGLKVTGTYSPTRSFKHIYSTKIGCWGSGSYTLTEDYDFLIINVCAIRTGVAAQCDASYSGKGTATTYRATSWWDDGCSGLSRQILVTGVSKGDKVSFGNCAYSAQVNIVGINKN